MESISQNYFYIEVWCAVDMVLKQSERGVSTKVVLPKQAKNPDIVAARLRIN